MNVNKSVNVTVSGNTDTTVNVYFLNTKEIELTIENIKALKRLSLKSSDDERIEIEEKISAGIDNLKGIKTSLLKALEQIDELGSEKVTIESQADINIGINVVGSTLFQQVDLHNVNVNVVQIVGQSGQYNDLLNQLKIYQKLYNRTSEDEVQERLEISRKINELNNKIEQFKQDVLKLAEAFQKIEINTERLIRTKEHFDKGEIGEARAVLETELKQMQTEQKRLLKEREHYEKKKEKDQN